MRVSIGKERVELADVDLLGVGGEARVFSWRGRAVKVYHPVPTGLTRKQRSLALARQRERESKIRDFPSGLPSELVCPRELVFDVKGKRIVGYVMDAVVGAEELRRLGQRKWREGAVSSEDVTEIFRRIHDVLVRTHEQNVIIGDLNDANVLFSSVNPWFIDTDSMQFGSYRCHVAHEKFLDPRLYGVDLAQTTAFTEETDWYAYTVMLFSSLLYVHPYGGVHPVYPTPLRRAEAAWSVLRPDVRYPRVAEPLDVLTDALLDWFAGVFDRGRRERFPRDLLDIHWSRCRCGRAHARARCPVCARAARTVVPPPPRQRGECQYRSVLETRGRVLFATVQGTLRYLFEEEGILYREDRSKVTDCALTSDVRLAIGGRATWIGHQGRLVSIEGGAVTGRASCGTRLRETVFDASSAGCYRLDGEWLVDTDSGLRMAQVLEGQTWLRCGEELGFGFYRAGLVTVYFLFRPGKPGLRRVDLPPLEGHLLEVSAIFDRSRVLFECAVESRGRVRSSLYVIDAAGQLRASVTGDPDSRPELALVGGKAMAGDCVLCPTDDGLLSFRIDAGTGKLLEGHLYRETEPFLDAGASLLPGPGGSVYVVSTREIGQLTLAPQRAQISCA